MTLFVVSYLAGVLTIVSPCILPILPFVFSRAGQPFARSILPMMVGMAANLRGGRDTCCRRRKLGGACERDRTFRRHRTAGRIWRDPHLVTRRSHLDRPDRRPRRSIVRRCALQTSRVSVDRCCSVPRLVSSGRPAPVRSWAWS